MRRANFILMIFLVIFYFSSNVLSTSIKKGSDNTGLIAHYPFDGNTNDVVNGNNAINYGATLTFDRFGNADSAYQFNNADNYPAVGNAWMKINPSEIQNFKYGTISIWAKGDLNEYTGEPYGTVKSENNKQFRELITRNNMNRTVLALSVVHNHHSELTSERMRAYLEFSDNAIIDTSNHKHLYANEKIDTGWHHYVLVYGSNLFSYYVNGVLQESYETDGQGIRTNDFKGYAIGEHISFGTRYGSSRLWVGAVDDLKMFNRPLTEKEVILLFHNLDINAKKVQKESKCSKTDIANIDAKIKKLKIANGKRKRKSNFQLHMQYENALGLASGPVEVYVQFIQNDKVIDVYGKTKIRRTANNRNIRVFLNK